MTLPGCFRIPGLIATDPKRYAREEVAYAVKLRGLPAALRSDSYRRVKILVGRLRSRHQGDSNVDAYMNLRRSGSPFPPILVEVYSPVGVLLVTDGNHRVLAAQRVADFYIDAFIPWTEDAPT